MSFLLVIAIIGNVCVLPLWLGEMALGHYIVWSWTNLVAMVAVALFSSVLAYLFWNRGVAEVGANVAGLFVHLMPVFGIVLAWLFLGEAARAVSRRRHRADPFRHLAHQPLWTPPPRCGRGGGSGDRLNGNDDNIGGSIGDADRVALQQRIVALKLEHRDLDTAIERLERDAAHDELQLRRLKRRKLLLKDNIARLERQLDPDVLA